jgi:glycosyltransferase involved in cell wall biosynthesis
VKACALIPIFDHGATVAEVVADLIPCGLPILIVDDGSGPATAETLRKLTEEYDRVEVVRRNRNDGKGAALKTGYRAALERGFSHVVQLDADGQHDASDVPRFLAAMASRPDALVLGVPVFDTSAPRARIWARQLSRGLVWLACLSRVIPDPLCGFRGVPLRAAVSLCDQTRTGNWMDFEPEIAVRLHWRRTPIVSLATHVRYLPGGVSHFSLGRDYPRLAWLYLRLVGGMLRRVPGLLRRRSAVQSA